MLIFRSLLLWLVLTSSAALWWPAEQIGFDPFRTPAALLWGLIVVTMFSLGTLVRPAELQPLKRRPWLVFVGVGVQVTVMPLLAWLATQMIDLPPGVAIGVILVGCVPGAMASNVLTCNAGGSVGYSVSLTTIATLLCPITVPTALWLCAGVETDPSTLKPGKTALMLFLLVVIPTIVGFLVSLRWDKVQRFADRWASIVASVSLIWIIAGVVAGSRESLVLISGTLLFALLVINVCGYAVGFGAGKLAGMSDSYRRALSLEVGMQNAGLGTTLAVTLFGEGSGATIPTAAYTFGCMLTGTVLATWWRSRPSDSAASDAMSETVD